MNFHSFMCFPPFLSRTLLSFSVVPDVLDKLFSQVYQLLTGQGVRQIKKVLGTSGPRSIVYYLGTMLAEGIRLIS